MSKKSKRPASRQLRGSVLSFNISPGGDIAGALVSLLSGTAQINFRKLDGRAFAKSMPAGASFELHATLVSEDGAHPVYLVDDEDADASGKVVRLNYARHGGVNGYHLDDGTFVHVRPSAAEKYQMMVGERIHATGSRHPGSDAVVLEARAIQRLDARRIGSVRA